MEQITPLILKQWIDANKDFALIDVRETWEHELKNIGGQNIPMGNIVKNISKIPKDKPVVLYCEKGIRSVIAIQRLEGNGFTGLYNLSGGINAFIPSSLIL